MDPGLIALGAGFSRESAASHVNIGSDPGEQCVGPERLKLRRFKIQS